MDSQIKVCPHCQTINEPEYIYCKRCGTVLSLTQDTAPTGASPGYAPQGTYGPQPGYSYSTQGGYGYGPATIDGIPTDQVDAFIGSKSTLKQKIHKMELTRSKVSWNWPVFLTTFLGGALLTPCWFFHRKMNKLAALLVMVGLVFTLLSMLMVAPVLDAAFEMMEEIVALQELNSDPFYSFYFDYQGEVERITLDYMQKISGTLALSSLLNLIQLAYAIVMSLFANYLYKRHIIKSITHMAATGSLTWEGIAAKGGTSIVGWMILGGVVLLLSTAAGIAAGYYMINEMFSYLVYLQ